MSRTSEKPTGIGFGEPPSDGRGEPRGAYDWPTIAGHLRERPGEWYMVYDEGPVTLANSIRQGSNSALHPDQGFQVMQRNSKRKKDPRTQKEVRTCALWVRWVDPAESSATG